MIKYSELPCTEGEEEEGEEEETNDRMSHDNFDVSLEETNAKTSQEASSPESDWSS